jgi:hypothetical protein
MRFGTIKTRTEVLLIAAGWLWTFALAGCSNPSEASRIAVAAGLGMALSIGFRSSVMGFFRADLDTLGDRLGDAYLWTIAGFVLGLVAAAYVLAGGPMPHRG